MQFFVSMTTSPTLFAAARLIGFILLFFPIITNPVAAQDIASVNRIAESNNTFALAFYRQIDDQQRNIIFSPYSLSSVLSMTYAGARGETAHQMAKVLNIGLESQPWHSAFGDLNEALLDRDSGLELKLANTLWLQTDYDFRPTFLEILKADYTAQPRIANFATDSDVERRTINEWVATQTDGTIPELLQAGSVDTLTRLVLVNAVYFKGRWKWSFDPKETRSEPFFPPLEKPVDVPMMTQTNTFGYANTDQWQILEMPYADTVWTMVMLLPKQKTGLAALEAMLNLNTLERWFGQIKKRQVEVMLPKFKFRQQMDLSKTLMSMGMTDAFGSKADFSGIDGSRELFISAVVHEALVEVNEEGTEAAAASGVSIGMRANFPTPVFRADHPFIFFIRDQRTGIILFLGKMMNPNH